MSAIELDTMSLDELKKLRKDVDAAIKSFEDRKKKAALAELEAKAAELGFNLSDLTGAAAKGRKVNPPKYRHPETPETTWSGRGRQPDWFKDAVAALMALGYKAGDADKAVSKAVEAMGEDTPTEDLIRAAFSKKG